MVFKVVYLDSNSHHETIYISEVEKMALVKHCENEEPKPCIICQKLCDNTNSYNFLLSGYTNGDETEVICQDCYQFGYANRLTNMNVSKIDNPSGFYFKHRPASRLEKPYFFKNKERPEIFGYYQYVDPEFSECSIFSALIQLIIIYPYLFLLLKCLSSENSTLPFLWSIIAEIFYGIHGFKALFNFKKGFFSGMGYPRLILFAVILIVCILILCYNTSTP